MNSYKDHVAARKSCRKCMLPGPGRRMANMPLLNGVDCGLDPDVVSHWSQWLGHHSPKLLIVGQDFSNAQYFRDNGGRDDPANETNQNLWQLLNKEARITVNRPPKFDPAALVYLANSILCLKDAPMNAPIPSSWVDTCSTTHLAPLVRLLQAPIVVGMGVSGWHAVRKIFGLYAEPSGIKAVAGRDWSVAGTRVFAVGHCGRLGLANRPPHLQAEDWRRIGAAFAAL